MAVIADYRQNHLLRALTSSEQAHWLPHLEQVDMPLGMVLYESGRTLSHVFFPVTSIVSILYVTENGASAEIAWWAMTAWWGSPCSWAETPPPTGRWCRAQASASGCRPSC